MSTALSKITDAPLKSKRRPAQVPTIRWTPAKAVETKDRRSWRNAAAAARWLRKNADNIRRGG
eukprot:3641650-Pyramimonas_sp.AAC.1